MESPREQAAEPVAPCGCCCEGGEASLHRLPGPAQDRPAASIIPRQRALVKARQWSLPARRWGALDHLPRAAVDCPRRYRYLALLTRGSAMPLFGAHMSIAGGFHNAL